MRRGGHRGLDAAVPPRDGGGVSRSPAALVEAALARAGRRDAEAHPEAIAALEAARALTPDAPAAHALGVAYEASLATQERNRRGSHYTPYALARHVVERALDRLGPVGGLRALDPAMGGGAFLVALLDALAARSNEPDTPALRASLAHGGLFGVDRDPGAVAVARAALWLAVGDASLPRDAFDAQLVVGDALFDPPPGDADRGYDLVIGNPPFLGGKRITTVLGEAYSRRLAAKHPGATRNTDLAAHFLRRADALLSPRGIVGFVVTNTIAQGDTREGGLGTLVRSGARIVEAETRVPWPGAAQVVTSLVWLARGERFGSPRLDGREVDGIDALLSPHGREREAARLPGMRGAGFIGCFLRGAGFVFDDRDPRAHPLAALERALAARPSGREVVFPFVGGDEVMNHPEHAPHRFVVRFGDRTLDEARAWPELCALVEASVRPFREARRSSSADRAHAARWWTFANDRPELARAIAGLSHVLVIPRVAAHLAVVRVPSHWVFSDQLVVVPHDAPAVLALLQSRIHESWARLVSSTLGDGLRYAPTDALETFPAPGGSLTATARIEGLDAAGRAFAESRATILRTRNIGLTRLYGLVRDAACDAPDVARLRSHWDALDRATFAAYGWTDLAHSTERDARGRLALAEPLRAEVIRRLFDCNARMAGETAR
jgi:methylase of polypeptide subunit release factors